MKAEGAAALLLLLGAAPALAQRANENVVRAAVDAFGSSVGSERIGLYSLANARGFSPVQAGNVRLEGLYYDFQADFGDRLVSGSKIRVGLAAQSYPFPAPTGIADFSLRKPGDKALLSATAGLGPFGGLRVELDGQVPISSTLGLAVGVGVNREQMFYGSSRSVASGALVARWRPRDGVEVMPFFSRTQIRGQAPQPIIFSAGPFLPLRIPRRRYTGQPWARGDASAANYGIVTNLAFGGEWAVGFGLFRSELGNELNFSDLALRTDRDGLADRFVVAEADRQFASTSGELRVTRTLAEGDRRHDLIMVARGRDQSRRFGGSDRVSLGRARIDQAVQAPRPVLRFGPQTRDQVRQFTLGLGYAGRWRDVGEMTLGLQKSLYQKDVERPLALKTQSRSTPWLPNGTLSIHATRNLVFYTGYSKGLEETPIAPEVARNRDEAPPATITQQMDAGLRWAVSDRLRVVAGVFDVRKPYYALDETLVFRQLGAVRHRGIELSLSGQVGSRLNVVLGTIFLDARLSGAAVGLGLVGPRPVNAIARFTNGVVEYQLPWVPGLSIDLAYESTSSRTADRLNTVAIPPRYVAAPGFRYRTILAGRPTQIRGQVANVNNVYGYSVFGEGVSYNFRRRYLLTIVSDF